MNVLVLGGTGAIGIPLVRELAQMANVFVTTRRNISNQNNENKGIKYIVGNAKNLAFLRGLLSQKRWDAVIDFMIWGAEFEHIVPLMLDSTNQYVFISSARVYAQSEDLITENTPRLLDVSIDECYLKTNEYALAKAREENLLIKSGRKNYTIIRPSITYNNNRLQLGVLEKENWLYRAQHGRSIVFSKDIAGKLTTMTFGDDVAHGIASLIGKEDARGEAYHITHTKSLLWSDVLDIYLDVLEETLGHRPRVVMTEKSTNLKFKDRVYQVIYCRYFNRTFDNSKIAHYCEPLNFKSPKAGLSECLRQFIDAPKYGTIDWRIEAINDMASGERTPLKEIKKKSDKALYLAYRYKLTFLLPLFKAVNFGRRMIS